MAHQSALAFGSDDVALACATCVALVLAHWHATKAHADLKSGLSQLLHFAEDWVGGKGSGLSPMAARVEEESRAFRAVAMQLRGKSEELKRVRLKMLMLFFRLIVHLMLVTTLFETFEFIRAPRLQGAIRWVIGVCIYLMIGLLNTNRWPLTPSLLVSLRMVIWMLVLVLLGVSGSDQNDILARHGLCQASQLLQTIIFPVGTMTMLQTASYFVVDTWAKWQVFDVLNPRLIMAACVQALVYMAIPLFLEFALREWIAASLQSKDSDSLIGGFRQMLKGICDGELLLDGNFQICGKAPCLQRLLSSSEDFAGRSFRDVLVDDEARKAFDDFLAPAVATSDADEGAEGGQRQLLQTSAGAAPRCLRVPLRTPYGQAISVDVFHVSLPSSLYGESTSYHLQLGCAMLLALKGDVDFMPPPEADPTQNVLPSSLLASRRPPSARSAASNESYEECYDELAEITLLVNASTALMDIEEAHLRFVRKTNKSKVRMGMPTLKRFARPLDWAGIDAVLRRYARKVRKAHAEGKEVLEEDEQAMGRGRCSSLNLDAPLAGRLYPMMYSDRTFNTTSPGRNFGQVVTWLSLCSVGRKAETNPGALRVEEELGRVRVKMCLMCVCACIHPVMVLLLKSAVEFMCEPGVSSGIWLFCLSMVYVAYSALVGEQLSLTPRRLHAVRVSIILVHVAAIVAISHGSKDTFLGQIGIVIGSQVLHSMLFSANAATVSSSVLHTALYIWATAQVHGRSAVDLWLLVSHMSLQVFVCNMIPFMLELTLRECIEASFQSQDSDSLIQGFRQMLKGICDGELLLDGDFQICGSAPCLQRLLSSREDFAGRSFRELIVDDDARETFDGFLAKAAQPKEATPGCLRIPLKTASRQIVSVDMFHVPLPRSLYGMNTIHHLTVRRGGDEECWNFIKPEMEDSTHKVSEKSKAMETPFKTGPDPVTEVKKQGLPGTLLMAKPDNRLDKSATQEPTSTGDDPKAKTLVQSDGGDTQGNKPFDEVNVTDPVGNPTVPGGPIDRDILIVLKLGSESAAPLTSGGFESGDLQAHSRKDCSNSL
ncbi:unnamed protein product [Symbiodinium sp. CCMP2456]|nr:unnamed protein product [Symbiodinium sp. CCMP2456]